VVFDFSQLNWLAVLASVVAGQIISTVWFTALFGEPWAKEYGAGGRKQHTKEIPGYTYAVQALATIVLVLSIALLQRRLDVDTIGESLSLGLLVSVGFAVATGIPGQAFLKRWRVAALASGSQVVMILGISIILGLWR
jgi:hypothetical protein